MLNFQKAALLMMAVFLFLKGFAQQSDFQFSFEDNPESEDFGRISIAIPTSLEALSKDDLKQVFPVYVGHQVPDDNSIPAILGNYQIQNNQLLFQPRFDPPPGITYTASLKLREAFLALGLNLPEGLPSIIHRTFEVPKLRQLDGKAVTAIYPSADTVPANLLRIYVHFNQPMSLANPHEHIRLVDESGEMVPTPFVEITEGLWNPNRTRLTLFFHPGRVKRGVGPNMTMGTILTPGNTYHLTFDPDWKDALGRRIGSTPDKSFYVVAANRQVIQPDRWTFQIPTAGSTEALKIELTQPLDHALAQRMVQLIYESTEVALTPELMNHERQLSFIPLEVWQQGTYFLKIDPLLEDLSGNTPFHLFDTATVESQDPPKKDADPILIPIVIR